MYIRSWITIQNDILKYRRKEVSHNFFLILRSESID